MNEVIHSGHRQRLKKRFLNTGIDSFEDHEVLELLLFSTIPQKDTNPIGHNLINKFGSLSGVLDAQIEDLLIVDGIGEKSAFLIKMISPMCKRYLDDKYSDGFLIDEISKAGEFMHKKFIGENNEVVIAAALDNKGCVKTCQTISRGTINATQVSVRIIVEFAVRQFASGIIIAHNHPNGVALPSKEDIITTHKIKQALELVNVRLIDHIIVSDDDYVSLNQSGVFV